MKRRADWRVFLILLLHEAREETPPLPESFPKNRLTAPLAAAQTALPHLPEMQPLI